jgi:hypothetical protein
MDELRIDMRAIIQALANMDHKLDEQTAMLVQVLDVLSQEPEGNEGESPLANLLRQIMGALQRLPQDIEAAVRRGVAEGLRQAAVR